MAFNNIEKDMQSFFNGVAKGVRDDMDKNFVHHITINFADTALGFHKGAAQIAGGGDYLGGNEKQSWENVIRKICQNWNKGSTGLTPGQVFRTKKTGSPSTGYNTLKGIAIPNLNKNTTIYFATWISTDDSIYFGGSWGNSDTDSGQISSMTIYEVTA